MRVFFCQPFRLRAELELLLNEEIHGLVGFGKPCSASRYRAASLGRVSAQLRTRGRLRRTAWFFTVSLCDSSIRGSILHYVRPLRLARLTLCLFRSRPTLRSLSPSFSLVPSIALRRGGTYFPVRRARDSFIAKACACLPLAIKIFPITSRLLRPMPTMRNWDGCNFTNCDI
jgi:hypothetical protein